MNPSMPKPAAVLVALALAGGGYLAGRPSAAPAAKSGAAAEAPSSSSPPITAPSARSQSVTANAATGDEIKLPVLANEADLDRYLDDLEATARTRGSLDDELRRAAAAGKVARRNLGADKTALKMRDFGDRISALGRQQQIAPTLARLDSLAGRMKEEKDPSTRAKLAREYTAATAELPPVERLEAMDRLATLQP